MSEFDVIKNSSKCHTKQSLVNDLKSMGIKNGDVILCHSSLSKIGWVCGREIAVVEALIEAIGEQGTLVMPCFSGENSDPSQWGNPPVPQDWIETIKQNMPPFDPNLTPTREMGRIVDAFWHYPSTLRSYHPQVSFIARGKLAQDLTSNHPLDYGFGPGSPLYKLYEMNAKVLLLGVGYGNCTCMHLAEILMKKQPKKNGCRIYENGISVWKEYEDIDYDDSLFEQIGQDYEKDNPVSIYKIGDANSRLLSISDIVEYTYQWFLNNNINKEGKQ